MLNCAGACKNLLRRAKREAGRSALEARLSGAARLHHVVCRPACINHVLRVCACGLGASNKCNATAIVVRCTHTCTCACEHACTVRPDARTATLSDTGTGYRDMYTCACQPCVYSVCAMHTHTCRYMLPVGRLLLHASIIFCTPH